MKAAPAKILIVDDELNMRVLFQRILEKEGYQITCASSGEEALQHLEREWFDVAISDLKMPGLDGITFVKQAKIINPTMPCIVLTAYGSVDSAVTAMKQGAHDYLTKPIDNEEFKLVVKKALDLHRLTFEVERLRRQADINVDFQAIIGRSKPMRTLLQQVKVVARSHSTVLIQGESGTGKELIARAIHQHSARQQGPFVAIDCGALPEPLLESELFGHARGAFTGAIQNKRGLFEEAHRGTLFLDEIGDTALVFQSKLMRVLQEGEIRPVGSNKNITVDVRVVTATNKDLSKEIEKRTFREDLYYRLAVVPLVLPPLRQRREDIPLLVDHFIKKFCAQNQLPLKTISVAALQLLCDAPWPGNVRELENTIERAVLLSPDTELSSEVFFLSHQEALSSQPLQQATKAAQEEVEREKIRAVLFKTQGVRAHAAKLLGISRATLYSKLKHYQLD
ncbi:MAG: sigma-54-dependent transcriptional regulator [Candidatus Binatia bacterium]